MLVISIFSNQIQFHFQIQRLDQLHEENRHKEIYDELAKEGTKYTEPEILWRFARACYYLAYPLEMKNPKKRELLDEGKF
jgi:hypothetical protein